MEIKKYEISAKNLLIKYVNDNKNFFDFNIVKTNKVDNIDKNKVLFVFQCNSVWSKSSKVKLVLVAVGFTEIT